MSGLFDAGHGAAGWLLTALPWVLAVGGLLAGAASMRGMLERRRQKTRARQRARHRASPAPAATTTPDGRDSLTGLVTRAGFEAELERVAQRADGGDASVLPLAVLCVGFDDFRQVNHGWGHRVGDGVLVEAARRLAKFVGAKPWASRVGGDEFVLIVQCDEAGAASIAERAIESLKPPYRIEGVELRLSVSVGVALYPEHGVWRKLVSHAALAMRSVKLGGGSGHAVYDPSMAVDLREQAELLQDLRQALEQRQLQLVYQPKIDAKSLQVTAAEALLRWMHPKRGVVSPAQFVPLAEKHGLIGEIGEWVIAEACRQAEAWRKQGLRMRLAINVSGHQLRRDDFVPRLLAQARRHGIAASRLTCEITETVAMEDTVQTRAAFEQLRKAGFHVSIDDFGTGHSSLAVLRRLPAAELKIDRAFVADLGRHDAEDEPAGASCGDKAASIIEAIVGMARTLGLRVVAEGVETEAQRDALVRLGCDELQGYLFAKPMSATAVALWAADDGKEAGTAMFRPSLFEITRPAPQDI